MTDLPSPLMTSEPGSFARSNIVERRPQILRQVIQDNAYPEPVVCAIEACRDKLAKWPVQPLAEQAADAAYWNQATAAYG